MPDPSVSHSGGSAFPFPVLVDESLPEGTIRIEAAQTHLVKLRSDGSCEFVAGPLDGTDVRDA